MNKENRQKYIIQQKSKKIKPASGITMIALVITTILLMILTGVTITQISGENGIIKRAQEAVERYKNATEQEEIEIGELEQYVTDYTIVGKGEGEKALVGIKGLKVKGDVENREITVDIITTGEVKRVQYSIDNGKTWEPNEEAAEGMEGKVKEGTEGEEKETEFTYKFKEVKIGKSYFVKVIVYDERERYVEAVSDIVTLNYIMTAQDGDVLEKKTYLKEDGTLRTGTMPNNGKITATLSAGQTKEIPTGYTSGGMITVKTLKEQTSGTAVAGNILKEKTAWVNGVQITGTMADNGAMSATLSAGQTKEIPAGYTSGGTITVKTLKEQTSGTAVAGNILKEKTAWVNGVQITGTMTDNGAVTKNLIAGESYTIPAGYHNGNGKVTVSSLANQTQADALDTDILKGKTAWVNGKLLTGKMENNGSMTATLSAGQTKTIPAGYTSGGTITVKTLKEQTNGTAVAGDILSGKKAWVNGVQLTGTMENFGSNWVWTNSENGGGYGKAEYTYSNGSKAQMVYLYTRPGYATKNTKIIVGTETEIANSTLAGRSLLGVQGKATSDANAGAGDILSGKSGYVNGTKVNGNMANKSGTTQDASVSNDSNYTYLTIPSNGYYNTSSKLRVNNSNLNNNGRKVFNVLKSGTWGPKTLNPNQGEYITFNVSDLGITSSEADKVIMIITSAKAENFGPYQNHNLRWDVALQHYKSGSTDVIRNYFVNYMDIKGTFTVNYLLVKVPN